MATTATVESSDGTMDIFDAEPDGPAKGAVIVIQEAYGVNNHIQDVCERFAAEGYRAVAPHLFHRSGDPTIDYDDMQTVIEHIMRLSLEGLESDLGAALEYLSDAGVEIQRTGIVGFCMGGSVVFLAAARRQLGAAVTFYGGGITEGRFGIPPLVELAPDLMTPWLGLYGDADQSIPVEQVEALREAVKKASVPTEIVRYPGADHAFHCDARDSYHEQSAKDAWKRTLDWFDTHLKIG